MIGSATAGPFHTPTFVRSLTDFFNQFGGSLSESAVRVLFRNNPDALLYFSRAALSPKRTLTIGVAQAGAYTLSISGDNYDADVTYTATASDTLISIRDGLVSAINSSDIGPFVTAIPTSGQDAFRLLVDVAGETLTLSVLAGSITPVDSTGTTLADTDYVNAIEQSFDLDDEYPQGFVLAPEAFQFAGSSLAVGLALETLADARDWVALIDAAPTSLTVAQLTADAQRYASPQGHSRFYGSYLRTTEGGLVPASPAVAAMTTKRFSEQGYHQPSAGAKYPLRGVTEAVPALGNQEQSILNPLGINLVRKLANKGVVIWGMRTLSTDELYKFGSTRVIMNILNGTLRRAFDNELFNSIDGSGVLMGRIRETARAVCRQMWEAKALYGAAEVDAFQVVCGPENNPSSLLEQGAVLVEVYVAPAPNLERLLVATYRVSIGQVQSASSVS